MRPSGLFPLVIALAGCAHAQQARSTATTAAVAAAPQPVASSVVPVPVRAEVTPPSSPIYFDFDEALLSRAAEAELDALVEYLAAHPAAHLTISGNADERGTVEYNLALGDRRAQAAREYLERLGIGRARVKTISYGELRPAVPGHDEAAWAKNRRDELAVERKQAAN